MRSPQSEINELVERVQHLIRDGKGRNDGVILSDLRKRALDLRTRAVSATSREISGLRKSLESAEDYDRGEQLP